MAAPIEILLQHGFPRGIVESLQADGMEHLLDQQIEALHRFDLLSEEDLLVALPTSAGKTLIGELAGVGAAISGKRTVFSVPLKALAREKFETFRRRYRRYGLRVCLATGEFDRHLADIRSGRFDIAVMIHEKFLHTILKEPGFLHGVGVAVLDELQGIEDPVRGPKLEFLLALLKQTDPPVRVVGLSGVLAAEDPLVKDFGGVVLTARARPVDLKEGIVLGDPELVMEASREYGLEAGTSPSNGSGMLSVYRSYNTGLVEAEWLPVSDGTEDRLPKILRVALGLAAEGESVLVFLSSRRDAELAAQSLSECIPERTPIPDDPELNELDNDNLRSCLYRGVGFHHADCSPRQRALVESRFRTGKILILCCTSTLAMGVNLPAHNVLIHPYVWSNHGGRGDLSLLPETSVRNMAGRAGRLGFGTREGRALLVAESRREWDLFRRRYWTTLLPPLHAHLMESDLASFLLAGIATGHGSPDTLEKLLAGTLSGRRHPQVRDLIREGISRARACRLVTNRGIPELENEDLVLTPLGRIVAVYGIGCETGYEFFQWAERLETGGNVLLVALLRVCFSAEARRWNWPRDLQPETRAWWVRQVRENLGHKGEQSFRELCSPETVSRELEDACKMAWVLWLWAQGEPLSDIRTITCGSLAPGTLHHAGDKARWLLECLSDILHICRNEPDLGDSVRKFAGSVGSGLPDSALAWRVVPSELLDREEKIRLAREVADPFALLELDDANLERIGSPVTLERVRSFLGNLVQKRKPEQADLAGYSEKSRTVQEKGYLLDARFSVEGNHFRVRTWRQKVSLGMRSAELLIRLVRGRKEGSHGGWVSREDLGVHRESLSQRISDLRKRLGPPPPGKKSWIESDHRGHYRIACEASKISWDPENLPTEVACLVSS